jgi:DNA-binding NtrC family response regulator
MTEAESLVDPFQVGEDAAILCVDDEPRVLAALLRALNREPYEVFRAGGGREALELLERFPVKVIISDERMPEMSGTELLAEVKRRWPWVRQVILTGYPGPAVMMRSLESDTDVLMSKPWDEEMLKDTIRRLIREGGSGSSSESWRDLGGEGG